MDLLTKNGHNFTLTFIFLINLNQFKYEISSVILIVNHLIRKNIIRLSFSIFWNQKVILIPQTLISIKFLKEKLFFLRNNKSYFFYKFHVENDSTLSPCKTALYFFKYDCENSHVQVDGSSSSFDFFTNYVPFLFLSSWTIFNVNFFATILLFNISVNLFSVTLNKMINNGLNA